MKSFELPDSPSLVVVSDVHVRTEHDERYALLCSLVDEALRVKAKSLVLNGDIFDFFFGWRGYFRGKYKRLFIGLDKLVEAGTTVWFVCGNHEFALEALSKHHKFEVIASEGKVWIAPNRTKILIAHGDLMRPDFWYAAFRSLVRSPVANILASIVPQILLDKFTLWFASTSRKKDKYRVLHHDKIIECAKIKLQELQADSIIFGHFHHPYHELLDEGKYLLSVTSWDQPSCLILTAEGNFARIEL